MIYKSYIHLQRSKYGTQSFYSTSDILTAVIIIQSYDFVIWYFVTLMFKERWLR